MNPEGMLLKYFLLLVLGTLITACSTDRDNEVISSDTWQSYIDAGPIPERQVRETRLTPAAVTDRLARQQEIDRNSSPDRAAKQILFGDTHVHTSFSLDAIAKIAPPSAGTLGAFPPADACDYARYISQLDFYFLTDHAKAYTPETWDKAIDTVRNCNRVAGNPDNPDVVA